MKDGPLFKLRILLSNSGVIGTGSGCGGNMSLCDLDLVKNKIGIRGNMCPINPPKISHKILDNNVTLAKIADGTQGGLIYMAGSGAPTELAAGTSGYFLKTLGSGANPTWAEVPAGAPTGGGSEKVFYENENSVDTDYTLTTNYNAVSAGPVTVASGVTVTIPAGQAWVIV